MTRRDSAISAEAWNEGMTTEAPAYVGPIPADHPSRAYLAPGRFDADPATLTNRELVQAFGSIRWESGVVAAEDDLDQFGALDQRAQHLQTEIIRRLGGIA